MTDSPQETEADLTAVLQSAVLAVPVIDSDATAEGSPVLAGVAEPSFRDDIPDGDSTAKTGPPKVEEWQKFFSRIVIKYGTDFYMNMMLRDIDPAVLQPSDLAQLHLEEDERKAIARPFAEFANKSKLARKHGRMIVSSADSVESVIILLKWSRSVSRIGRKYRKPREKTRQPIARPHQHQHADQTQNGTTVNGNSGPGTPASPEVVFEGFSGN